MTHKQRFIHALTLGTPTGQAPTFELVFFLTMEAFGKVFPGHRHFSQWDQMSETERTAQLRDAATVYVETARRYGHSAIFVHGFIGVPDSEWMIAEEIRNQTGDEYFLMRHGDATYGMPSGENMMAFVERLADDSNGLHREFGQWVDDAIARSEREMGKGIWDGFALCSDYCFNTGPFFSPDQFAEYVTPYLARLIAAYRDQGFYTIKHTDGNIMPILDQLVQCRPHALHSLDPQAGVDIAEVKRRYGREICLIGNVNCGLMQTGSEEDVSASARYALQHGMPGGGYIFSTSNCVFTGMALERYELINRIWRKEAWYPHAAMAGSSAPAE